MATWPATLPQSPTLNQYQETAPDVTLRTQMDAGPPKLRRRFTAGIRLFDMSFVLSSAQVQTLEAFYTTTLVGGTLAFDWTNPRTSSAASFRFSAPPQYSALGPNLYQVVCKMEILP